MTNPTNETPAAPTKDTLSLAEFIAEEKQRIDDFETYWKLLMAKEAKDGIPADPETGETDPVYPEEMYPGDWDDQLMAFDPDWLTEDGQLAEDALPSE